MPLSAAAGSIASSRLANAPGRWASGRRRPGGLTVRGATGGGGSDVGGDSSSDAAPKPRTKRRVTAVADPDTADASTLARSSATAGGRDAASASSSSSAAVADAAGGGAPKSVPRGAPKKKRTVRRLKNNAGVTAAVAERKAREAAPKEAAPVSQEREMKELAAAQRFKKLATKIAADFEADDAMAALGMGMGSAAQTKKIRDQIMGVDTTAVGEVGKEELVPRTMLEEVVQARRTQDAETQDAEAQALDGQEQEQEGGVGGGGAAGKQSGDSKGAEEGGGGDDVKVKVVAPHAAKMMALSDPNETPGQRLKRLFREKRERGLARVREKFSNQEMFDQLAASGPGATSSSHDGDGDGDEEDMFEKSESIFGEAAKASQANRDVLEEGEEGEGGFSPAGGAVGLLQGGGNGLSPNNSIDPFKLIPGEYVVHRKFGIGKFLGIRSIAMEPPMGEDGQPSGPAPRVGYLFIEYADQQAKIKPEKASEQLYRYASPGAIKAGVKPPKLSRIQDRKGWQMREANTKKHIRQLVVNQMCVYLQRLQCMRQPYQPPADEVYQRFNDLFAYDLTPDQAMAVNDCYEDLSQRDTPMDRIVVGDVGFGKTEVAMRAVFRVFAGGGQVFILAPTTVLAKQHAATMAARLRPFGASVELLNRNVKESERVAVLKRWKDGETHVVVGTHILLNLQQEMYGRLKLLVIDEEQRFGVKHKDQISALKASVDVLTLSATPIPRTLHMAIAGFRDASLVTTPPPERRPINTKLQMYDHHTVHQAIQAELDRQGQIFYVVPKIQMMADALKRLQGIFPDLRVMAGNFSYVEILFPYPLSVVLAYFLFPSQNQDALNLSQSGLAATAT